MLKKLKSRRGETLVETLAAIIIIVLASIVLLSLTSAAVKSVSASQTISERLDTEFNAAESQVSADGTAQINIASSDGLLSVTIPAEYSGTENDLVGFWAQD